MPQQYASAKLGHVELRSDPRATSAFGQQIFEPIAQLIVRPNEVIPKLQANEDAQSLVFDETNLFALDHGREARMPIDLALAPLTKAADNPTAAEATARWRAALQQASDNTAQQQRRQKKYADRSRREVCAL